MPIHPLPQFEADVQAAREADRVAYEKLKAPRSLVVRFGVMKLIGEFPYDGPAKPGCGSRLVVRTHRGTELGEMLTATCPNAGCEKSVTRQEVLGYIENSGGRDYPFFTDGRVLRVATRDDLDKQASLEQARHGMKLTARRFVGDLGLPMKIVDAEPILGGERLTFFFASEERIEFRDLARRLGEEFRTRIDLRQVGARDEARLTADYERCGQYCCCKNFLKVLKPVSMKSAKVQKATLDPLKISGRCGRLMCCLRYEDQTYEELAKRLPRRKSRVGTPEGDGMVLETQILTQLALVLLDGGERQIAVPVEELREPASPKPPAPPAFAGPPRPDQRQGGPPRAENARRPPAGGPTGTYPPARAAGGLPPRPSGQTPRSPDATPAVGESRPLPPAAPRAEPPAPAGGSPLDDFDDIPTDTGENEVASPTGLSGAPANRTGVPGHGRRRRRRRRRGGGGGPPPALPPPGAPGPPPPPPRA